MAFGSDEFPLGPAGGFPHQRIRSAGVMMPPPMTKEEVYMNTEEARLPVIEKDFHSSLEGPKQRMKHGMSHDEKRIGQPVNPRYTEEGLNKSYALNREQMKRLGIEFPDRVRHGMYGSYGYFGLSGISLGQRIKRIIAERRQQNYGALVASARMHEQMLKPRKIRMGIARSSFFGARYY